VPTLVKAIYLLVCLSVVSHSHAKSQALLIGIGQYPGLQALQGPVNDVALMKKILTQNANFPTERIEVLIDEEATRRNILKAMDQLLKTTEPGDKIILYFSGHGTSAFNDRIDADLPSHSGALVPYDIDNVSNKDELHQQLLIGRRDLRPVLSKLDATGAEVLVLVDACFSGNVVRGDNDARNLPSRFLDFSELLQFRSKKTIDKPTSLVPADFTLADLHVATRRLMKKKGLLSTPQLLPNNPARTNASIIQYDLV